MKNNLLYQIKPPCGNCPYKLGLVKTLSNPCPQCRENGYQMLDLFQKRTLKDNLAFKHENEQAVEFSQ